MSLNQVGENMDSRRAVSALGEFVNKEVSMSNLIMDQKCKGVKVRITEVKVMRPEVERQKTYDNKTG